MDKCITEPGTNDTYVFNNAIQIITKEMQKKDKIIEALKKENELLKMKIKEMNKIHTDNIFHYIRNSIDCNVHNKYHYYSLSIEKNKRNVIYEPSFHPNMSMSVSKSSSNTKTEIKKFLKEVKGKISEDEFKKFIEYVKILTIKNKDKANVKEKEQVLLNIKALLTNYQDLYEKLEGLIISK